MKIKVGELIFKISFEYQQFYMNPRARRRTRRNGWTECRIMVDKMGWVGRSECSRKDPFIKAVGRCISLQRALEVMGDTRSQQRAVIEEACQHWLTMEKKKETV